MAITVTNRRENVDGNYRQIIATLGLGTSSEAWVTGLKIIRAYTIDGGTAAVTSVSVSGGTLTIGTSAGATAVSGLAWGY
jgi:hypothetical protein